MRSVPPESLTPLRGPPPVHVPRQLIANNHSIDEIREIIGADSLGFLSEEHVFELADGCKLDFCAACFNGKYPIEIPADTNKTQFEKKISEKNEKENL